MIDELVRKLARARADEALAALELDSIQARIDDKIEELFGEELDKARVANRNAKATVVSTDAALRAAAIAQFEVDGNKQVHDAVTISVRSKLVYDAKVALVWAKENLPLAIDVRETLNKRLFSTNAKALLKREDSDVPAHVKYVAGASVSTDLDNYLPKEQAEDPELTPDLDRIFGPRKGG